MSVTIIITTYNRPNYLNRLIYFYKNLNVDFRILILDSSHKLINFENDEKIEYVKYDSNTFISEKINKSLSKIKTRYVLLCADDDFIFPSAIQRCTEFLDQNHSYASCHGLYYNHLIIKWFCRTNLHLRPLYSCGTSLDEDSSLERVNSYILGKSVYYPFYAVHRTETFVKIWTKTAEVVEDWGLSEICPSALSLVYGKMKVLDLPYATREPNISGWIDLDRHKKLYSKSRVGRVIKILANEISGLKCQTVVEKLNLAFETYISKAAAKLLSNPKFSFKRQYLNIRKKIALRNKIIFWEMRPDGISRSEFEALKQSIMLSSKFQNEILSSRKNY